ncbi:hypothetical protein HYU40_03540 [Candidatus Woesearchaeota archaeon]|nr:hypothetical protein [Candidatus Woesearchaeota archaeon]
MRKPYRSSIPSVLSSNDQSRVLASLVAEQPKYAFMIAKEWFGNRASSHSTRIGNAIRSLEKSRKKSGLIRPVAMAVKQPNSSREVKRMGYKINISQFVKAFCEYLTYEADFRRHEKKEFTKEEKKSLVNYFTSATCRNYFKKFVIGKPLMGSSFKCKDSVFTGLKLFHIMTVFDDEKSKALRKEIAAYYNREDTAFVGHPEDEEIFKKVKELLE